MIKRSPFNCLPLAGLTAIDCILRQLYPLPSVCAIHYRITEGRLSATLNAHQNEHDGTRLRVIPTTERGPGLECSRRRCLVLLGISFGSLGGASTLVIAGTPILLGCVKLERPIPHLTDVLRKSLIHPALTIVGIVRIANVEAVGQIKLLSPVELLLGNAPHPRHGLVHAIRLAAAGNGVEGSIDGKCKPINNGTDQFGLLSIKLSTDTPLIGNEQ
mmetsp:Transcript_2312/g.5302  ORF Transcript_2312/g.5302 Transcript_2312/m.5302 type:complete len:216 (-) Transcript_2312:593-1240(-)